MQRIGRHHSVAILRSINDLIRIGLGDRFLPTMIVEDIRSTEWASITFAGVRHEFDLRLEGAPDAVAAALHCLAEDLRETEIPIAGFFLAEIALASRCSAETVAEGVPGHCIQRLCIEALTIRD